MGKIKVIVVSSVKLSDKSAAAITLARHLSDDGIYETQSLSAESYEILEPRWLKTILGRLERTRFAVFVRDFRFLVAAYFPLHRLLPAPKNNQGHPIVLTVACGNGWLTAAKYARRYGLPLAVRFDDWWPDTLELHAPLLSLYSRKFRDLVQAADLCFCISEGMLEELGNPASSAVVLPIPEAGRVRRASQSPGHPFRVCYLGNMFDYGPMLRELAEAASPNANIRIEFRGTEPNWPNALKEQLKASGQLHRFSDGEEFQQWYESFDCYLVAMFFEEKQRRRVRTCFATKLLDYSAMGRPIVIWAPEESSVVVWARKTGMALCVTDPDAGAVGKALDELAADPARCRELGDRAREAYETDFDPERLKRIFDQAVYGVTR